jgi:hypothetical protein
VRTPDGGYWKEGAPAAPFTGKRRVGGSGDVMSDDATAGALPPRANVGYPAIQRDHIWPKAGAVKLARDHGGHGPQGVELASARPLGRVDVAEQADLTSRPLVKVPRRDNRSR